MRVQCLLVVTIINFKRLGAVSSDLYGLRVLITTILDAIWIIVEANELSYSILISNPTIIKTTT